MRYNGVVTWRQWLALFLVLPAAATFYFFVFWRWFDFWRRHRGLTYLLFAGAFAIVGGVAVGFRRWLLAGAMAMPAWVQGIGWALMAVATVFGTIADRQIGLRVRSFTPFFEDTGRIELKTDGAYAVVRHPIYASGFWFQLGGFLVTGFPAVIVACAVFFFGALWFTRQEEKRLVSLLADPKEYELYRADVPALFPRIWPRRPHA